MSYRVGIVGCGRIASRFDGDPKRAGIWTHAGAYRAVPKTALIAAADIDPAALDECGRRWGIEQRYADYRAMLREAKLDIVSICTPPESHAEIAVAAAEAGVKAIWCEKPMAATVEDAKRMLEACGAQGAALAVNHVRRWEPCYQRAKAVVDSGVLGRIHAVTAEYSGGIANIGSHMLDVLRWLFGEIEWVLADALQPPGAPDPAVSGSVGFRHGAIGRLIGCDPAAFLLFEIHALGTEGQLHIAGNGSRLHVWRAEDSPRYSHVRELALRQNEIAWPGERMVNAVTDLVRCMEQGAAPACSGEDGLRALELVDAFRQSAESWSRVPLSPVAAT